MTTKLTDLRLTSVDLVRTGANQQADICLFKSAAPTEAESAATELETIEEAYCPCPRGTD